MKEKKLKPFDLEKAKQGAKVVTRDGRPARIICWDRVGEAYPMVALVEDANENGEEEIIETYTLEGACVVEQKHGLDLFMAPTIVERWVNVYKDKNGIYNYIHFNTEQVALEHKDTYSEYVTTSKISWEE